VSVSFTVPSGAHKFSTALGNDTTQPNPSYDMRVLTFDVFVDGYRVDQRQVQGNPAPQTIDVDVTGKSTVKLSISFAPSIAIVRADWGDPQFN
jgi:hypothetical protein